MNPFSISENGKNLSKQLARFKEIASLRNLELKSLCDHILKISVEISFSPFGFLGIVEENEENMYIHAWSGDAVEECKMVDKPTYFNISEAGIWAEAVRLRRPLLINEFNNPHAAKKGLPTGHVKLTRLLSIPIIINDKIKGVIAVANKEQKYTQDDIESLESFATLVWILIENQAALKLSEKKLKEQQAMFNAAKWVLESKDFTATARKIFDAARELTGAQSGYVALLTEDGAENEVLFLEAGGIPCTVDESLPMPIRGLRSIAYRTHQVAMDNDFMKSQWVNFMPEGHVELKNVLFAPLNIQNQTVGIMGLANKNGDFTKEDQKVSTMLGDLAAIALQSQKSHTALKNSESYLWGIFQNMSSGLAIYDVIDGGASFRIADINKAGQQLSRADIEVIRGKELTSVFPKSIEIGLVEKLRLCYETGEPQFLPLTHYEDERITQWVENRIFKLPSGQVAALYQDRTRQRQLEDRLRQSEKMESIGNLAGGIAHDFNNILGAIIGYSELGLSALEDDTTLVSYFQQILKASERARKMVYGILSFSRQSEKEKTAQYIRPIIEEVIQLLKGSFPSSLIIEADLEKDQAPVLANTTQIHEVIINLCTNAAYAMDEKGTIHISFSEKILKEPLGVVNALLEPGKYASICVSDSGSGIPLALQSKIFDPFFTTKPQGEGTGMGLAMVFGIIQDHKGGISLKSTPEKGTTFCLYLPYTDTPLPEKSQIDEQLKVGSESIIVVDDEEMLCKMMSATLNSLGYQVSAFTDSLKALEEFGKNREHYDLVITDQTMPGLTGSELAQEMMLIKPEIPIILCTGYSKKINKEKSIEMGIRSFLNKPIHIKELSE